MSEFDPFKLYRDLQGNFAALQRAIDPFRSQSADLLRAVESSRSFGALHGLREASLPISGLALAKNLLAIGDLDRMMSLSQGLAGAAAVAAPHLSSWNGVFEASALQVLDAGSFTRLSAELGEWQRLVATPEVHALADRAVGWAVSIQTVLGAAAAQSLPEPLVAQMLRPTSMFARLGMQTAKRLHGARDSTIRQRLQDSMRIVEAQVVGHIEEVRAAIHDADDIEDDALAADGRIRLATREQAEMLAAPPSVESDLVALASTSEGSRVHQLSRRALHLVFESNRAARMSGGTDVFKLTNRLFQVALNLPWMDAQGERSFGDFIDDLYFLLYEGAGKDKLRYLRDNGGPLDGSASEVVFCIKHLRNKWLRHDPEHGDPKDVRKSYLLLRERLEKLGLEHSPRTAHDYRLLQMRLLEDVVSFLERLLAAQTTSPQP